MLVAAIHQNDALSVFDYRCASGPADRPFTELHTACSISYVRRGSFGYRYRGQRFELVAGAVLVGHIGDEYTCTHDHVAGGDECLCIRLSPALMDTFGLRTEQLRIGRVPPLPELIVLGELAQASARGDRGLGVDEAAWLFVRRFAELVGSAESSQLTAASPRDRKRAALAAQFIDTHAAEVIDLETTAKVAGLSPFHFLRVFGAVLGVTPHQYLLRARLRRAARLLTDEARTITAIALDVGFADLSNFVRTFQRAAGVSPTRFRALSKGDRRDVQGRLAACRP